MCSSHEEKVLGCIQMKCKMGQKLHQEKRHHLKCKQRDQDLVM